MQQHHSNGDYNQASARQPLLPFSATGRPSSTGRPTSLDVPAAAETQHLRDLLQTLNNGGDAAAVVAAGGAVFADSPPPPSSGESSAVTRSPSVGYVTPPPGAVDAATWHEVGLVADAIRRDHCGPDRHQSCVAAHASPSLRHQEQQLPGAQQRPLPPATVVVGLQPSAPHAHPRLVAPPASSLPHSHHHHHHHQQLQQQQNYQPLNDPTATTYGSPGNRDLRTTMVPSRGPRPGQHGEYGNPSMSAGVCPPVPVQQHQQYQHHSGFADTVPSVSVGNRQRFNHQHQQQQQAPHRWETHGNYSYPAAIAEYARAMATERRSAALNGVHAPPAPDVADFARFVRAPDLPDAVACMALAQSVTAPSPALLAAGLAQWRPAARAGAGVAVQTLVVGQMPYFVDAAGVGRLLVELAATDRAVAAAGGAPFAAAAIVAVRAHERVKPAHGSGTAPRRCGLWFVEVATDGACKIVLDALLATHRKALVSDTHVTVVSGGTTLERWAAGRDGFLQRLMAEVPDVRRDAHSRFNKGLGPVSIEICSAPMRRA